jgi:predicted transcriptional regulator
MKKINDTVLIEMADNGAPQNSIALHFGVSEAAISKRLKRLRQQAAHSAILDKLTAKEQRFVAEICSGTSQTQSAVVAFDVGSIDSAKAIGNRLMKDDDILQAISSVMEEEGLSRRYLVKKLKGHVDSVDSNVSLRAVDMGLKLHDAYPAKKSLNLNASVEFMPIDLEAYR